MSIAIIWLFMYKKKCFINTFLYMQLFYSAYEPLAGVPAGISILTHLARRVKKRKWESKFWFKRTLEVRSDL